MNLMKRTSLPVLIPVLIFFLVVLSGCTTQKPSGIMDTAGITPHPIITMNGTEKAEMKTIGIIGGMSWYSTQEYYRIINEEVQKEGGGLHSAKILMYSEDFAVIEELQHEGKWDVLTRMMIADAQRLEQGGADFIIIGTNTMHKTADDVKANIHIPLLHIADATGAEVNRSGIKKVALLGTKYTMEQDFYRNRLINDYGLVVVTPNATEREYINRVIFEELCAGLVKQSSKEEFIRIINRLETEEGADGVILGCTEIPLLIKQADVRIPVFDTTRIHSEAAVDYALNRT